MIVNLSWRAADGLLASNPRFRNLSIGDTDDLEAKNQADTQMLYV